jgi:hypothetical protein
MDYAGRVHRAGGLAVEVWLALVGRDFQLPVFS